MSKPEIFTREDGSQFTIVNGVITPYTPEPVPEKEYLIPNRVEGAEPIPPEVFLAPIEKLRGQSSDIQQIDDAGFTNEDSIHVDVTNAPKEVKDYIEDVKSIVVSAEKMAEIRNDVESTKIVETIAPIPKPTSENLETQLDTQDKESYSDNNLKNIKYKITSPVSLPIKPDSNESKQNPINIAATTIDELNTITENLPGLGDDLVRTLNPKWVESYYNSIEENISTNSFVESMKIPGSFWTQKIEHLGGNIGPRKAAIGDINEDKLTGAAAVYHMQALLSAGTSVTHPFWASGVFLTIRNPSDSELGLLEESIRREKISVGRTTLGLAYSNQSVFLVKHVFNFIKDHIYKTSVKDLSSQENKDIGDILKITDLYPLIHLLACTIYPDGHAYNSPCLNTEPSKCGSVVTEVLQLFKMFWNKDSSITPEMRRFMANPDAKKTVKEIEEYQKLVAENCSDVIDDIHPGFKVVARIPTINEYIESGERWIMEMGNTITNKLGTNLTDVQRNNLITEQAKLTSLREYVHCFDKIIYANGKEVEKRADIEAVFNVMSTNHEVVDNVSKAMNSFISRHTLTVIGIPNYVCVVCGKQHNPDVASEHSLFTPLDPMNLFFILKDRKIFRPE